MMNPRQIMLHTPSDHTKKSSSIAWHTNNEKSGTKGQKWYCDECGFMMVFIDNPNSPNNQTVIKENR
jgi:rubrerythrin